jgi:hypothetical protein
LEESRKRLLEGEPGQQSVSLEMWMAGRDFIQRHLLAE